MYHLIFAVMSIVMMSASIGLYVNYMPLEAYKQYQNYLQATESLESLKKTTLRYLDSHRDEDGDIVLPGLDVDITEALSPTYGFIPREVENLTWSVKTGVVYGEPAVGICLSPKPGTGAHPALMLRVASRQPVEATFLGTECNAVEDVEGGYALTYWMLLSHHN